MVTYTETKFKRFLNYGHESSFYEPSDRFLNKYYEADSLPSVEALVADGKVTDAVVHIVKAFSDGYSAHPESLIFALAMCARQKGSAKLREAAYNAFRTICKTPMNLFLFVKFSSQLSAPSTGWGRGMRRIVKEWYLTQEPLELAENVTKYRGSYNWTHKDILKLAHPKSIDIAKRAVLKYVVRGLKETKEEFGDKPQVQQVLNYLQAVEDLKHFKDTEVEQAARHLEHHNLCLEHVPSHLLKSHEMWGVLIPQMALPDILSNLKRFGRLRLLRGSSPVLSKILSAMTDPATIAESDLHPANVLIILRSYEQSGMVKYTNPRRDVKPPPQPNHQVLDALHQLLESTFKLLVPTGMRYLVAVDTRDRMTSGQCWKCGAVPPLQAAALLALCLVKAELDVTVVAFGVDKPQPVGLQKNMTLQEALDKIRKVPTSSVDIADPVLWAEKIGKSVDVFVVLTDFQLNPGSVKAPDALSQYRKNLNLPNTKYVLCALVANAFTVAAAEDPGMLDMSGFDGKVPQVIEAFSRGAF